MCADFQDPPEMIVNFIREWEKGSKVVIGKKNKSFKKVFGERAKNGGVLGEEIFCSRADFSDLFLPAARRRRAISKQVSFLAFMNQIRQNNFKSL